MRFSVEKGRLLQDGKAVAYVETPNKRGRLDPEFIVVHDTASGLNDDGDIAWLTRKGGNSSAHMVLARDGMVTQLAPFSTRTWHAGQSKWDGRTFCNGFTLGLEIDNPGKLVKLRDGLYAGICTIDTHKNPELVVAYAKTHAHGEGFWLAYSDAQIAAVTEICRALVVAYPKIADIVTHWMISPGRKIDTNPLFPIEAVKSRVFGGEIKRAPQQIKLFDVPVADATVTARGLNLRGMPVTGEVLAVLPRGTRVDVQESSELDGWYRVIVGDGQFAGKTGFVASKFVALDA